MPIPPETDKLIRDRFETLVKECKELAKDASVQETMGHITGVPRSVTRDKLRLSGSLFEELRTKFLSLLQILSGGSIYISLVMESVTQLENTPTGVYSLVGKIKGLKDDYESAMFINLIEVIEADVAADYMGQAEQLLGEGQRGKFDHVPAAVLTGAVLEDALRRLCKRQVPPISILKANGDPKTLNPMIDDLKKAGLFNELKAKQLRAWADIRNKAAHGEFGQFVRHDVEQMIAGVEAFLSDHL